MTDPQKPASVQAMLTDIFGGNCGFFQAKESLHIWIDQQNLEPGILNSIIKGWSRVKGRCLQFSQSLYDIHCA